jgi:hypothetical protein
MEKKWFLVGMLFLPVLWLLVGCGVSEELHGAVVAERDFLISKLQSAQSELESTNTDLSSTKTELQLINVKLDSTEIELLAIEQELNSTKMELISTKASLDLKDTELTETKDALLTTRNTVAERESELSEFKVSYEGLMADHGYTIKDPTYSEMKRFLKADHTDRGKYIRDIYDCEHFSADLCRNADEEGIRCAFAILQHPEGISHAIVAFNTIDEGMVYIEPQTDDLVKIEVGKPYYQCVVPEPGYYYPEPEYDDTIIDVIIIW